MKPEIKERYQREQRQYQIWVASFQAKLRRADSLAMTHRYIANFIGIITRDGERYRLTTWRPNGPNGHEFYNGEQLAHEVYYSWWLDPTAQARLDSWVGTPEWVTGMQQLDYLEIWNAFMAAGKYDLCHTMDEAAYGPGGLLAGIETGRRLQQSTSPSKE